MKLIMVYGPPASGKLTISKEVVKLTGYKLFHNHLANDLIAKFIDDDVENPDFWKYVGKLKDMIFDMIVKENINLVTTWCYTPADGQNVKAFIKRMKAKGVKLYFVNLACSKEELHKRVKNPLRKKYRKVQSKKGLSNIMEKYDFYATIPNVKSYKIDNSRMSAKRVAEMIVKHYKLKKVKK